MGKRIHWIKGVLAAACVALQIPCASAQWRVGVEAGYTYNRIETARSYDYSRIYNGRGGLTIGVPVQYAFSGWFALQTGVSYETKNYSVARTGDFSFVNYDITNEYLQIPVHARFSFGGRRFKGFLSTGGYVGCWLSSRMQGVEPRIFYDGNHSYVWVFDEKVAFDSRRDNRFEAGIMIGVGLQYEVTKRIGVFAEGRYLHSLTDMQKAYMLKQIPRYNRTFGFRIGAMFSLGAAEAKHLSNH